MIGTVLRSRLDTRTDEYRANLAAMQQLWDTVAEELATVPAIGGQRYVDRHRRRGKMLVRERVEALVDPGTPLLELSPLAGWGTDDPVGVGSFNAIGVVEGVECAITASDMTYRGGSANPVTVRKQQRFHEIVRENRLPLVILNEAAFLPYLKTFRESSITLGFLRQLAPSTRNPFTYRKSRLRGIRL